MTKQTDDSKIEIQVTKLQEGMKYLIKTVDDLNRKVDNTYVTKEEFKPVKEKAEELDRKSDNYIMEKDISPLKNIVYGIIGVIVVTFMGVIANFFISAPK